MISETGVNLIGKRYLLEALLGQGAMGSVFRATDRLTGRLVALKKVATGSETMELSSTYNITDFRIALAQEFKLSASLRHPNIIEVLDYGFMDADSADDEVRQPYFTMELLENPKTILDAGRDQTQNVKITLLIQMLQALSYLHRRDILHRDLKPANVLVSNPRDEQSAVKVLDFGLSVMRERTAHDEAMGTLAGTLAYMAPEILMGAPASESTDMYAVGIMAYELMAGKHPFDTENVGNLINQTLYSTPNFSALDVRPELEAVIERLLQKTPQARYGSASEVIAAFNAALDTPIPLETAATRESFLQAARLVGRDTEIKKLSDALDAAVKGHGSTWLIAGENGVGKSRLIEEIRTLAMVQGALVMRGQALGVGRSPYDMWRPVFRWLCLLAELTDFEASLLKPIVSDLETLLGRSIPDAAALDPETAQIRILQTLENALRGHSHPIVMIFEDLHWAGSESLAALAHLTHITKDLPLLVLASYRDDERPELAATFPDVPLLKLNRLTQQHIIELSAAMLGAAGTQPQVLQLLQKETEGNVFFLIEVVRALAEEAGQLDQIGLTTLPQHVFAGGVRQIIQRRLGKIAPKDQPLLQISAVIGRELDLKLMRALEPTADLDGWLTDCANASVFEVQDGHWRFAHDRLRDGVLESLEPAPRRALHGRIADTIESLYGTSTEHTTSLAYHWAGAENVEKEEYYVTLAGRQELRSGAYREAIAFVERALALVNQAAPTRAENITLQKRANLQMQLAEAYLGLGRYDEAARLYRENLLIFEQLNDTKGMAEALGRQGDVEYALGKYQRAGHLYQESLSTSQSINDQTGIARALNNLGNVAYELGDSQEANKLYQQSLKLSREIGGQWGMAGSLGVNEDVTTDQTEYAQAKKTLLESLRLYEQMTNKRGMADTLYKLGVAAFDAGQFAEAEQFHKKSLALREEITADALPLVQSYDRLGLIGISTEKYADARQNLLSALKFATTIKSPTLSLHVLLGFAKLLNAQGFQAKSLELLTFVAYHDDSDEKTQDDAERLMFMLEADLPPDVVESSWEKGKYKKFEQVIEELVGAPAAS